MAPSDPHAALAAAQAVLRRRRAAAWCAATAALLALAALALGAADAAFALGDGGRSLLGWLWLAAAPAALAALVLRWGALAPRGDAAVRTVEAALGDRARTLAQSLELARRDGELPRAASAALAARLDLAGLPARLPRSRAPRWLLALAAAGLAAAAIATAAPDLARTVCARWIDPYGDHPPWSPTRLDWAEAPLSVRARHPLRVEVAATGRPCAAPVLVAEDGAAVHRIAMFPVGAQRWAAEIARVENRLAIWAEGGGTRTRRRGVLIDPVPELDHLDVRVDQPAYAALAPTERRLNRGEQAQLGALAGATLTLAPAANRPLAAVHLASDAGAFARHPLDAAGRAAIPLVPGLLRLRLEAADGALGEVDEPLRLALRPDLPPTCDFAEPARDVLATPDSTIAFTAVGGDDLGLAAAERGREVNGLPLPTPPAEAAAGRTWRWTGTLDLLGLGAEPGDVIALTAMVRDTDPAGGADGRPGKPSGVAQRRVQVIGWDEYNQMLLRRLDVAALEGKYRPLAEELAELQRQAAALAAARPPPDELDRALADLARRANALAAKVEGLRRPRPLFRIEPDLQRAMAEAARDLAEGRAPQWDAQALARDLAELTRRARGMDLVRRLGQLADAEQNTVERIQPLAGHRRPTDGDLLRLAELAQQEELLAEELKAWLGLARAWAEREREALPRETAELDGLADALDAADAIGLKRAAAAAGRAGDGREAHRQAAEARDRLLALLPRAARAAAACAGGAALGMSWTAALGGDLGGLMGVGGIWGLGGRGSAGLGLWLGYGGDDLGSSPLSMTADLHGPENLGATGAERGDAPGDPVAAMAASGQAAGLGAAVRRATAARGGQAATRTALGAAERRLVDDYFRKLEETR